MTKSGMRKTTVREIGHSLGRYLAMMAIIALGVGFFSGLKAIKPAMIDMANSYLTLGCSPPLAFKRRMWKPLAVMSR